MQIESDSCHFDPNRGLAKCDSCQKPSGIAEESISAEFAELVQYGYTSIRIPTSKRIIMIDQLWQYEEIQSPALGLKATDLETYSASSCESSTRSQQEQRLLEALL
jgi:hypothetical protein